MDRTTRWNWVVDALNVAAGLIVLASSLYFLYLPSGGLQGGRNRWYGVTILFDRHTWEDLHTWAGVAMIVIAAIHLVRHWYWVRLTVRQVLVRARTGRQTCSPGGRRNLVVNAIVALSFVLAAISGIYFFLLPEGGFQGGRNAAWDPGFLFSRTNWDLLHTWSGVTFILAVVLHFWIHWRWVTKVTTRILSPRRSDRSVHKSIVETGS